jgi:3-oxoacyl-[acyl-carrier protein] reductase
MTQLLKDQVAIVTGGTAGIGRRIALKFAEQGAKIAIFGTNIERGELVVEEIRLAGHGQALFYQVDIAQTLEVEEVVKRVLAEHGKVDILINNAGITIDKLLMKMDEADWDNVMDINVKSCYNTCRALVRSMIKAHRGKIINMSSVIGLTGNAGQVNYSASKAAIIGFTKALAKELAPRNICANCIAPGFIETRMTDVMSSQQKESTLANIPLGRMGTTTDISNAALFLASSLSDYITGQVLTVDGGMVM